MQALGWFNADELITYHRVIAVHKLLIHDVPKLLVTTIGPPARQQHHHNTRIADLLTVPHIRTEAGRSRLCFIAVKAYNSIPRLQSMSFKTATKRYLFMCRESGEMLWKWMLCMYASFYYLFYSCMEYLCVNAYHYRLLCIYFIDVRWRKATERSWPSRINDYRLV